MASIKDFLGSDSFKNLTSLGGPLASIAGGLFQGMFQKGINEQNIQMQRETNALQQHMFNQNLAWQKESQQMQNEYNSMGAQLKRAADAGVSASALFNSGGSPAMSTPASVGSPGSSIPSLTAPHNQMIDSPFANSISNISMIAKALSDVSSSGLSDAKANEVNTLLSLNMEKLQSQIEGQEIYNLLQGVEFQWKNQFKKKEYDLMCSQYALQASEIALNEALTDTEKENKLLKIEETYYKKMQGLISKKDLDIYDEKWNLTKQSIRQTMAVQRSEIEKNKSESTRNYSMADLLDTNKRIADTDAWFAEKKQEWLQYGKHFDVKSSGEITAKNVIDELFETEFQQKISDLAKTNKDIEKAWTEIKNMEKQGVILDKESKWVHINQATNNLVRLLGAGTDALQYWKPKLYKGDMETHDKVEEYSEVPYYELQTGDVKKKTRTYTRYKK